MAEDYTVTCLTHLKQENVTVCLTPTQMDIQAQRPYPNCA